MGHQRIPIDGLRTYSQRFPEEIQRLLFSGESSEYGEPVPVTEERIRHFSIASGDDNPIHTDVAVAKKFKMDSCIAQGDLVVGMLPVLLKPLFDSFKRECVYPFNDGGGEFSYHRSVPSGKAVKARATVVYFGAELSSVILIYKFEVVFPETEKLVASGTKRLRFFF